LDNSPKLAIGTESLGSYIPISELKIFISGENHLEFSQRIMKRQKF
jgi:hypothetical protein